MLIIREYLLIFISASLASLIIAYAMKLYDRKMAEFICNLKKYRQMKELTQEQLAEKVGVRRETIMRLEAGKYNPSLKLAVDISRVVETPIEKLFIFN